MEVCVFLANTTHNSIHIVGGMQELMLGQTKGCLKTQVDEIVCVSKGQKTRLFTLVY